MEHVSPLTPIGVAVQGVSIILRIGDRAIAVDYDTANRLAVILRGQARIAKKNAGDHSTKVIGFAHLTDGVLEELKAQRDRDSTAVFIRPKG